MNEKELFDIANRFELSGNIINVHPFGEGHINSTFLIETDKDKYILQRINNQVFPSVEDLMDNISIVTSFISSQGKETIKVMPTKEGKLFLKLNDKFYRVLEFVKNTICYQDVGNNLALVESEGEAFGELHQLLSKLDASLIKEVIPDFHNTEKRYKNFLNAKETASIKKINAAKEEIDFILSQANTYSKINDEVKKGNVKIRIIHNDTKINNVLFDKDTGLYRCVIDLDTMMPGSVLFDVGDALRSLFTGDNEDTTDLSLLKVNFPIYEAFVKGYLSKMRKELTEEEVDLIPFSIYLLSVEIAMRFLEDYLRGNVYFHADYEEHNLVRARTQIALAKDALKNVKKLKEITLNIDKN